MALDDHLQACAKHGMIIDEYDPDSEFLPLEHKVVSCSSRIAASTQLTLYYNRAAQPAFDTLPAGAFLKCDVRRTHSPARRTA
jgi:hypothetical protein